MIKTYTTEDVVTAARRRINQVLDEFPRICVSFSGGKDSTALLHLTLEVCRERKRLPVEVLFIDWEAQYLATIEHVEAMLLQPDVKPWWIALPLSTDNGSSVTDPLWIAWDKDKRDLWVRPMPEHPCVVRDYDALPFFRYGMTFEEFVPLFQRWLAGGEKLASLVGIRADESLNRFRTIAKARGSRYNGLAWTREDEKGGYVNAYPLYDWGVEDVWAYVGKNHLPYNRIYDRMWLAGVSIHDMRINEPYGPEARKAMDKHHQLEPETWSKLVQRVEGANFGAKMGLTTMFARGNRFVRPKAFPTWRAYAEFLLSTYPPATRDHYMRRINVLIKWWEDNRPEELRQAGVQPGDIFDEHVHPKKESWRTVCKVLLQNDYFCKALCFSVNKNEYEKMEALKEKYRDL